MQVETGVLSLGVSRSCAGWLGIEQLLVHINERRKSI